MVNCAFAKWFAVISVDLYPFIFNNFGLNSFFVSPCCRICCRYAPYAPAELVSGCSEALRFCPGKCSCTFVVLFSVIRRLHAIQAKFGGPVEKFTHSSADINAAKFVIIFVIA